MDLSEVTHIQQAEIENRLLRGLAAWGIPDPMTLEEWAREHFYLSAESSYVEQKWVPWTFQRAIMATISNDDIEEVDFKKSARIGYTKIILAALGYFAEHKRRNQVLWQPTDDDAEDFAKSELDPMLRDVAVMQTVFPSYAAKHKDNTVRQKKFVGSILRIRGGKAAKNYRRFSADVAIFDELSGFDGNIEKEGDPWTLGWKRTEGATFRKGICGSTPKLKGFCQIDKRYEAAQYRFKFNVRCPHCGEHHPLSWGGKDLTHGFKWIGDDENSVMHMCPHCQGLIDQGDYLRIESAGFWISECGRLHLLNDGTFTAADGSPAETPRHIAFHVWTAYSPAVSWVQIVREFIKAHAEFLKGDDTLKQTFTNTTLGETWEVEVERTDVDELRRRAEPYALRTIPRDCLLLLAATDTQDNRLETGVWGIGRGGQMWPIEHKVFWGSPAQDEVWIELEAFLFGTEYSNSYGVPMRIYASAIDSGGHHADDVYAFAHKHKSRRVYAIKGASGIERSIDNGNTKVGYRRSGRIEKNGPTLWHVGTNLAKDRFQSRLEVDIPGPGYVHFSNELSEEWYRQLAGEARVVRRVRGGSETRWMAERKRVEVKDIVTYVIWLEERLDLWATTKARAKWWDDLDVSVQPSIDDLFAVPAHPAPAPTPSQVVVAQPAQPAPASPNHMPLTAPKPTPEPAKPARRRTTTTAFASQGWSRRQ